MKSSIKRTLRIRQNGHRFYKSSNCTTCPTCEESKRPKNELFS